MTGYTPVNIVVTDTIRDMMDKINNAMTTLSGYTDEVSRLLGLAPADLNTLEKIAKAIGNDPLFSINVQSSLDTKASQQELLDLENYTDTSIANLKVIPNQESFIATEGQTVFNLADSYEVNFKRISVVVEGVPQFSPTNFIESSPTSITFTEPLSAGMGVNVYYHSAFSPIGLSNAEVRTTLNNKAAELDLVVSNITEVVTQTENLVAYITNEFLPQVAEEASKYTLTSPDGGKWSPSIDNLGNVTWNKQVP